MSQQPATLGELKSSGYRTRTVKQELRENLLLRLREGTELFPGIVGYEDTVTPGIVNALLAGHDLILLGLRGQAKTRLLRALSGFLDESVPCIARAPLRDDPLDPVSPEGRRLAAELGDDLPISWMAREDRYQEKLATPDVSMADLIGDIDPIKAASRGQSLLDQEAIAYGIIPMSNRGIFAVNELPDLAPRIQVALLNVMEERDVQIRGFPVRFPLDQLLVFSANPEDYTKRGNLITPLRDRIAAQIHTHYPQSIEDGIAITSQEAWTQRDGPTVRISGLARELVEEVARVARDSEWVDQASGVSARLTIALTEALVSNVERRCLANNQDTGNIRLSDFFRCTTAICGKVELVFEGEREGPEKVAAHLVGQAAKSVFDRRFPDFFKEGKEDDAPYAELAAHFKDGGQAICDDVRPAEDATAELAALPGMSALVDRYLADLEPEARLLGCELVLEGLHQHSALAREHQERGARYSDMVSRMWEDFDGAPD